MTQGGVYPVYVPKDVRNSLAMAARVYDHDDKSLPLCNGKRREHNYTKLSGCCRRCGVAEPLDG